MKTKIRNTLFCFLAALVLLTLPACGDRGESAEEILQKISSRAELPSGSLYLSCADEGEENYLSPDTANAMYGKGSVERVFPLVEEYAIYVSASLPCEIAVFRCYSRSDTDSVAAMCLERVDELRVLLKGTELEERVRESQVITRKKYVIMLIGVDGADL